jgi:hypothetical protein
VALQAQYIFDRFGKFPGTVPSMIATIYLQAPINLGLDFYDECTNAVPICEPTLITWPCGIEQSIKLERQPTQRTPCRSAMAGRPAVWRRKRRDKRCRSQSCPVDRQQLQLKKIENYLLERH